MIAETTIREVKERANIVELFGEVTTVKRIGSRYVAACPFHNEKTPSCYLRDDSNTYHCFGCGVSGNSISFVMQLRGLSFPDAVDELATRFGIEVVRERTQAKKEDAVPKNLLFRGNQIAQGLFERSFIKAPAQVAEYCRERRLNKETVQKFGIGFAPIARTELVKALLAEKYKEQELLTTGLVRRNSRGELYDLFAGRLTFPIITDGKKIVGFGARLIPSLVRPEDKDKYPKYLNSPETAIYQKSKVLYGLPQALPTIRAKGEVIVVEGYMDVIGLSQVGVENVVACCGTAVTEHHLERLSRLCKKIIFLFDGDRAGRAAAAKTFALTVNSPVDAWTVLLPEGEDPDTIAATQGKNTEKYLSSLTREATIDVYIDELVAQFGAKAINELGASSKAKIANQVFSVIETAKDPIVKDELKARASFRLQLRGEIKAVKSEPQIKNAVENIEGKKRSISELTRRDQEILKCVMALKEELPERTLMDPNLTAHLEPETLAFIEALHEIVQDKSADTQKKEETIALLRNFGPSWVEHWKKAHLMLEDAEVNLRKTFDEIILSMKKFQFEKQISELEEKIKVVTDEEERTLLVEEKISFMRAFKG